MQNESICQFQPAEKDLNMPEPQFTTDKPVLVTGATGYVAGWIIKGLLEQGLTVHAAVRDPSNEAKRAHLDAMADASPGTIRYFKADLLDAGSFDEAATGCRVIFHTASPFTTRITDPQRDLVDPALKGTETVLDTANKTESVERVVLTSSCAAIYGDNADIAKMPGKTLTEAVWNTSSSVKHQAYSYSKTVAERLAWDMADAQSRWKLVVINPSLVLGPSLNNSPTSESFSIVRLISGGAMKSGAPHWEIGAVDVRDVADAHLRAAFIPDAEGRHITSGFDTSFLGIGQMLKEQVGGNKFPKSTLPTWLIWLFGPLTNRTMSRKMISRNIGRPFRADNSKSKEKLGLTYRALGPGLGEMHAQLVAAGLLKP
jgi:dihydroflavonol-4-reductase